MARTFGKFTTTIYDSDEFRALTFEQQGVYYMLGLQGEISAGPDRWPSVEGDER